MDAETIYPKVKEILADVLALDESEIEPGKSLIRDLNAESIDFLDLIFRLEKEFNVKIPRGQIEKEARGSLSDAEFEQNGVVTPKGIEALKSNLPEVPEESFKPGLKVNEISALFTVQTLCNLVIKAKQREA